MHVLSNKTKHQGVAAAIIRVSFVLFIETSYIFTPAD
jgi:hypothetical protein